MSRSNYSDDYDQQQLAMWRGQVASAIRGKRGQAFLRDLLAALDAMPEKRLITNSLEAAGEVCAIGSLGRARGIDMSNIDPEDSETVAGTFNIADQLAREVVYENDEGTWKPETPEERWSRMRAWVASQIKDLHP
jgi:hypothetical protein